MPETKDTTAYVDYNLSDHGDRMVFQTGAIRDTAKGKGRYDLISPIALSRLAVVLEKGADKYAARNWEKGMLMSRLLSSTLRHIFQYLAGMRNEDHLGQAMFGIMAAIHTETLVRTGGLPKELMDVPDYGVTISVPPPPTTNHTYQVDTVPANGTKKLSKEEQLLH